MNIMIGDTIVTDGREIGIVEGRAGSMLTVRFPENGNRRIPVPRSQTTPLAELVYRARVEEKRLGFGNISLAGKSKLSDLVSLFGYSTGLMRRESLNKVRRQLWRAGLEISPETDRWSRDDRFKIDLLPGPPPEVDESEVGVDTTESKPDKQPTVKVDLPDPFWPTAMGLDPGRELGFLRALSESDPILCLLYVPHEAQVQTWIQGTWEGIIAWAFRTAQRFQGYPENTGSVGEVRVGSVALLHRYLKPTVLDSGSDALRLLDEPHRLNLITIKRELELPTDFARLSAVWPGPVFEFKPEYKDKPLADIQSINQCLSLVAGVAPDAGTQGDPLSVLNWAKMSYAQLMTKPVTAWGGVLSSRHVPQFKGSNESSAALALKAHLANWVQTKPNASLQFEYSEDDEEEAREERSLRSWRRIDLHVDGVGIFEIESMRGSGPMELFYHKKIFSRLRDDNPFRLIVPNEAILWAGPFLSDLAHHLCAKNAHVLIPSTDRSFLEIRGKQLAPLPQVLLPPEERSATGVQGEAVSERLIRLQDVAGYQVVQDQIRELITWPEKHRWLLRPASRSSGVLFFGPPGCGKSRWARAIAGELEQEVRLLAPSDLRGPYIGWGQIMIREQFDWLAENDKRMLIIDELDAVARSRHETQMHSDDKASVNELIVQMDRVLRLGRLIVATTNFIGSMDDAVLRSGRFGHFIPVPPPDLDESIAILAFYLKRLDDPSVSDRKLRVQVPEPASLTAIVEPRYNQNLENGRVYCGADLEQAVNRAYLRSARRALPDGGWSQELGIVTVHLTEEDLDRSLTEVPRSVQADALAQFREDLGRYCDPAMAESIMGRLCAQAVT